MLRELTGWKEKLQPGGRGSEGLGIFARKGVCVWWKNDRDHGSHVQKHIQSKTVDSVSPGTKEKKKKNIGATRGAKSSPPHGRGGCGQLPHTQAFVRASCRDNSVETNAVLPPVPRRWGVQLFTSPHPLFIVSNKNKRKKRTALVMACVRGRGNSLSPPRLSFKANIWGFIHFIKKYRLHFIYRRNIHLFLDVPKA